MTDSYVETAVSDMTDSYVETAVNDLVFSYEGKTPRVRVSVYHDEGEGHRAELWEYDTENTEERFAIDILEHHEVTTQHYYPSFEVALERMKEISVEWGGIPV